MTDDEKPTLPPVSGPSDAPTSAAPPAAPAASAPLPTIPGYQIIRLIGEGGMGAVYEAMQQSPRRTVAIKVMRPGLFSAALVRRFRVEVDVLGRLEHPGV